MKQALGKPDSESYIKIKTRFRRPKILMNSIVAEQIKLINQYETRNAKADLINNMKRETEDCLVIDI